MTKVRLTSQQQLSLYQDAIARLSTKHIVDSDSGMWVKQERSHKELRQLLCHAAAVQLAVPADNLRPHLLDLAVEVIKQFTHQDLAEQSLAELYDLIHSALEQRAMKQPPDTHSDLKRILTIDIERVLENVAYGNRLMKELLDAYYLQQFMPNPLLQFCQSSLNLEGKEKLEQSDSEQKALQTYLLYSARCGQARELVEKYIRDSKQVELPGQILHCLMELNYAPLKKDMQSMARDLAAQMYQKPISLKLIDGGLMLFNLALAAVILTASLALIAKTGFVLSTTVPFLAATVAVSALLMVVSLGWRAARYPGDNENISIYLNKIADEAVSLEEPLAAAGLELVH